MNIIVVIESGDDWIGGLEGVQVIPPGDYLANPKCNFRSGTRVYNLCRSYAYQSMGYYVSLLAEARGQRPIPDVMTIQDLHGTAAVRLIPQSLDELIQKSLKSLTGDKFTLSVYFGENMAASHSRLAKELYGVFRAPLLQFKFKRRSKWRLQSASAIALSDVSENHREFVAKAAREHFLKRSKTRPKPKNFRYDMAILHNPAEGELAPSDEMALKKMVKAAAEQGIAAELITNSDASRILEFDALFIRETTAVNHSTYRLARRAEAAGLVVIDDPLSILRCSNKVFLAELLNRAKIPTPKTIVVHRRNIDAVADELHFPCVLKRPDSAFSKGVAKADNRDELNALLKTYFSDSELVIAQAFMRTDFDWRIGILDQQAIFACKYHMANGHWQIAKHSDKGEKMRFGKCETLSLDAVPAEAIDIALRSANLVGSGLYGVDVKEAEGKFYIIEVNDNPNLDSGIEDAVLKDDLYRQIMKSFVRRIEESKNVFGAVS